MAPASNASNGKDLLTQKHWKSINALKQNIINYRALGVMYRHRIRSKTGWNPRIAGRQIALQAKHAGRSSKPALTAD